MSEIKPALSAEEWAVSVGAVDGGVTRPVADDPGEAVALSVGPYRIEMGPGTRHAVAARCLHDHPAGFTWEGLAAIQDCIAAAGETGVPAHVRALAEAHADRIAALLPPEEREQDDRRQPDILTDSRRM